MYAAIAEVGNTIATQDLGAERIEAWPIRASDLAEEQVRLAALEPSRWEPSPKARIAGCFVCFERGEEGRGRAGEEGWAAAVVTTPTELIEGTVVTGPAGAAYRPGLLALREGPLLSEVVSQLSAQPDVLLVNATGRDHPRRCGLTVHLGAVANLATVGVTHRPLLATGSWPEEKEGATSPLRIGDELVGFWVRNQSAVRPIAVHAGWRTSPGDAVQIVLDAASGFRTPTPIREARRLAREARSAR